MGTDLILKHKNKIIAHLGRAYQFESNPLSHEITTNKEKIIESSRDGTESVKKEIIALAAYKAPASHQELNDIINKIEEMFEYLEEHLTSRGKKLMLSDILENSELTCERRG